MPAKMKCPRCDGEAAAIKSEADAIRHALQHMLRSQAHATEALKTLRNHGFPETADHLATIPRQITVWTGNEGWFKHLLEQEDEEVGLAEPIGGTND